MAREATARQMNPPDEPQKTSRRKEIVKFTIANLKDQTVNGKMIPEMEFHFRPLGAPPEERAVKYKVYFGGKVNKAPREVVDFLKTRVYDIYRMYEEKDESGNVMASYPVKCGSEPRFMVSEVG